MDKLTSDRVFVNLASGLCIETRNRPADGFCVGTFPIILASAGRLAFARISAEVKLRAEVGTNRNLLPSLANMVTLGYLFLIDKIRSQIGPHHPAKKEEK